MGENLDDLLKEAEAWEDRIQKSLRFDARPAAHKTNIKDLRQMIERLEAYVGTSERAKKLSGLLSDLLKRAHSTHEKCEDAESERLYEQAESAASGGSGRSFLLPPSLPMPAAPPPEEKDDFWPEYAKARSAYTLSKLSSSQGTDGTGDGASSQQSV